MDRDTRRWLLFTDIDVASNTLKPGVYKLIVSISNLIDSTGSLVPIAMHEEGPIIEFL